MKTKFISLKAASVILALTGFTLMSSAVPTSIDGTISFSGSATIDDVGFVASSQFTAFNNVTVGSAGTLSGDYLGTSGAAVTVTPFTWAPTTASTPVQPLWSFTSGGNTYWFDLDVLTVNYTSASSILLSGLGTAYITGPGLDKVPTSGLWNFSAQTQDLQTFTFSSSTTVPAPGVPEGGTTIALLGSALFGLGLIGRKRSILKIS